MRRNFFEIQISFRTSRTLHSHRRKQSRRHEHILRQANVFNFILVSTKRRLRRHRHQINVHTLAFYRRSHQFGNSTIRAKHHWHLLCLHNARREGVGKRKRVWQRLLGNSFRARSTTISSKLTMGKPKSAASFIQTANCNRIWHSQIFLV